MTVLSGLDAAGRRRSPATLPGYHAGRPPLNKGVRYPADPPTVEEIVAVMRHASDDRHGWRVRAMIVGLWLAGLRIQEALALTEHGRDHPRRAVPALRNQEALALEFHALDIRARSIVVICGRGGPRREIGMARSCREQSSQK